jgi:hypothetical protein
MTQYNELCEMMKEMDDAKLQPSNAVILNILSHARGLQEKRP